MDDTQKTTDNALANLVAEAITKLVENAPSVEAKNEGLSCIGETLQNYIQATNHSFSTNNTDDNNSNS